MANDGRDRAAARAASCALAAALLLAQAPAPALAEGDAPGAQEPAGATTELSLVRSEPEANVSVTVPVEVPLFCDAATGAFIAPSNAAIGLADGASAGYCVYVSKVKATMGQCYSATTRGALDADSGVAGSPEAKAPAWLEVRQAGGFGGGQAASFTLAQAAAQGGHAPAAESWVVDPGDAATGRLAFSGATTKAAAGVSGAAREVCELSWELALSSKAPTADAAAIAASLAPGWEMDDEGWLLYEDSIYVGGRSYRVARDGSLESCAAEVYEISMGSSKQGWYIRGSGGTMYQYDVAHMEKAAGPGGWHTLADGTVSLSPQAEEPSASPEPSRDESGTHTVTVNVPGPVTTDDGIPISFEANIEVDDALTGTTGTFSPGDTVKVVGRIVDESSQPYAHIFEYYPGFTWKGSLWLEDWYESATEPNNCRTLTFTMPDSDVEIDMGYACLDDDILIDDPGLMP